MFELKISILAPELAAAINSLADALSQRKTTSEDKPATQVVNSVSTTLSTTPIVPVSVPNTADNNVTANDGASSHPPVGAFTYTLEQLAAAGGALVQSGKREQCLAILKHFGANSLSELSAEQYGAFAAELRTLGARI